METSKQMRSHQAIQGVIDSLTAEIDYLTAGLSRGRAAPTRDDMDEAGLLDALRQGLRWVLDEPNQVEWYGSDLSPYLGEQPQEQQPPPDPSIN